jgi:glucose-1-phosphate thymidylyltransferase
MLYLITGGSGFIGSTFVKQTLKSNKKARVIVLDAMTYAGNLNNLKVYLENEEILIPKTYEKTVNFDVGAIIFAYPIKNPKDFGFVEFDSIEKAISLEEKPQHPKSNYAVPGLYFYDNEVVQLVKNLKPSTRGEIEINDLNKKYLEMGKLRVILLGRGMAWLDTGTHESLLEASSFVEAVQKRRGFYIACIEEIAFRKGYIDCHQLHLLANELKKTNYEKYLRNLCD